MKRSVAVYAGSFDPVTEGHLDIIRRANALFDLVVAVGQNPNKAYWFDLERRMQLIRASVGPDVRVVAFSGLLVHTCRDLGASVILRGIRSASDFDLESRYGLANRDLTGIETLFLQAAPETQFISSSLVKEIFINGGSVERYVPSPVLAALHQHNKA